MYTNFQGEGCNFFFEENEFFGRVATSDFQLLYFSQKTARYFVTSSK